MRYVESIELSKLAKWKIIGDENDPFVPKPVEGQRRGYRDLPQSRGLTEQDLNLLRKRRAELTKILDRVPWKFRFYFFVQPVSKSGVVGPPDGLGYKREGDPSYFVTSWQEKLTKKQAQKAFEDYGEPFPKKWKDSINIIHAGTTTPEVDNLPPTPWMIIHRVAHAVLLHSTIYARDWHSHYGKAWKDFIDKVYSTDVKSDESTDLMHYNKLVETMFTFRSARLDRIQTATEAIHEIFTDFIYKSGKLGRLNLPPKSIKQKGVGVRTRGSDKEIELAMRKLKKDLVAGFVRDLNKAVGKWYYT